jgi:hypothetical protein
LFQPDDPYYCGLRARIPNFAKTKAQKDKEAMRLAASQELPIGYGGAGAMERPHPGTYAIKLSTSVNYECS